MKIISNEFHFKMLHFLYEYYIKDSPFLIMVLEMSWFKDLFVGLWLLLKNMVCFLKSSFIIINFFMLEGLDGSEG